MNIMTIFKEFLLFQVWKKSVVFKTRLVSLVFLAPLRFVHVLMNKIILERITVFMLRIHE